VANNDCAGFVGAAVTVRSAMSLPSPAADAVIVAVPAVVAVKFDVAVPATGATGDAGLKVPDTPLTAKVMALVAVVMLLPLASWMVAVNVFAMPVCVDPLAGSNASLAGAPGVTVKFAEAPVSVPADTEIVIVPTAGGVKLVVATPLTGIIGEGGAKSEAPSPTAPVAENVI
jgi:hypothetical protein